MYRLFTGITGFVNAAANGDKAVVSRLISEGVDVSGVDGNGIQAIHVAINCGHTEIVELLLNTGKVSVDTIEDRDSKSTPLHCAVRDKQLSKIEFLVSKKANCNLQDTDGETPLHAAFRQFYECCYQNNNNCRMSKETDSITFRRYLGRLTDTLTSKCDFMAIAAFLIAASNADLSIQNNCGRIPLDLIPNDYVDYKAVLCYFKKLDRKFGRNDESVNNELCDPFWISILEKVSNEDESDKDLLKEEDNFIEGMKTYISNFEDLCETNRKVTEEKIRYLDAKNNVLQSILLEKDKILDSLKTRIQHFVCQSCREKPITLKLLCGHQYCDECYQKHDGCNVCEGADK